MVIIIKIHTLQSLPRTHFFLGHGFLTHFQGDFKVQIFQTSSFSNNLYRKTICRAIPEVFMAQHSNICREMIKILYISRLPLFCSMVMTFGLPQRLWRHGSPMTSSWDSRLFYRGNPRGNHDFRAKNSPVSWQHPPPVETQGGGGAGGAYACHIPLESSWNDLLHASKSSVMQMDWRIPNRRKLRDVLSCKIRGRGKLGDRREWFIYCTFLCPCVTGTKPHWLEPLERGKALVLYNIKSRSTASARLFDTQTNTLDWLWPFFALCCTWQSRALNSYHCTPEIWPWPRPLTLTPTFDLSKNTREFFSLYGYRLVCPKMRQCAPISKFAPPRNSCATVLPPSDPRHWNDRSLKISLHFLHLWSIGLKGMFFVGFWKDCLLAEL